MNKHACISSPSILFSLLLAAIPVAALADAGASAHQHDPVVGEQEPAAALIVEGPIPALLNRGVVVLPFRTEHLKIMPVYGEAAAGVMPRMGHLHVTLDHAPWHWVHASTEPLVIQGLSKGAHQLTLELADANHHVLQTLDVPFSIP